MSDVSPVLDESRACEPPDAPAGDAEDLPAGEVPDDPPWPASGELMA